MIKNYLKTPLTKYYWTQKYECAKAIVVVQTILTDLLLIFY